MGASAATEEGAADGGGGKRRKLAPAEGGSSGTPSNDTQLDQNALLGMLIEEFGRLIESGLGERPISDELKLLSARGWFWNSISMIDELEGKALLLSEEEEEEMMKKKKQNPYCAAVLFQRSREVKKIKPGASTNRPFACIDGWEETRPKADSINALVFPPSGVDDDEADEDFVSGDPSTAGDTDGAEGGVEEDANKEEAAEDGATGDNDTGNEGDAHDDDDDDEGDDDDDNYDDDDDDEEFDTSAADAEVADLLEETKEFSAGAEGREEVETKELQEKQAKREAENPMLFTQVASILSKLAPQYQTVRSLMAVVQRSLSTEDVSEPASVEAFIAALDAAFEEMQDKYKREELASASEANADRLRGRIAAIEAEE